MRFLYLVALLFSSPAWGAQPGFEAFTKWHKATASFAETSVPVISEGEKRRAVKRLMRKWREIEYASDTELYGKPDYWAPPQETIAAKKGDCEDFVILGYFELLREGFRDDDLRMVVVYDEGAKAYHALLVFRERGSWKVLDCNKPDAVMPDTYLSRFKKQYEINRKGWKQ